MPPTAARRHVRALPVDLVRGVAAPEVLRTQLAYERPWLACGARQVALVDRRAVEQRARLPLPLPLGEQRHDPRRLAPRQVEH
jgi:hypothetical protein